MAGTDFLIPLVNQPQQFGINLAGTNYIFTNKWNNSDGGGWILDIADANNNPIVCNIPLVAGIDCLAGLSYLGIQGSLYVLTAQDMFAVPTYSNLGVDSNLYFETTVSDGS